MKGVVPKRTAQRQLRLTVTPDVAPQNRAVARSLKVSHQNGFKSSTHRLFVDVCQCSFVQLCPLPLPGGDLPSL